MKILATADLHGTLPAIDPCDLLLIAGDVCQLHDHTPHVQRNFLRGEFSDWLRELPAEHIVGIAGNHDFIAEKEPWVMRKLPWLYLCDEAREVAGLQIHGTPWVPNLPSWAFYGGSHNRVRNKKFNLIPEGVDILLSHGPMHGHGDTVSERFGGPLSVGCKTMLELMPTIKPRAFVCGHIHEGFGQYGHTDVACGIYNVAHNDDQYNPINPPVEIKL